MIHNFKAGDKLVLNKNHRDALGEDFINISFEVIKCRLDRGYWYVEFENKEFGYRYCGVGLKPEWFDYYGKNVNNEVFNLLENNDIKSFQAVLDDGRIIHIGCLNYFKSEFEWRKFTMQIKCEKDINMYDIPHLRVFTRDKVYPLVHFNTYKDKKRYYSIDDNGEEHLLGGIDEWFLEHFTVIND